MNIQTGFVMVLTIFLVKWIFIFFGKKTKTNKRVEGTPTAHWGEVSVFILIEN